MEDYEKVEYNDSNESGKNRDLQKQDLENGLLQRGNQYYGAKIWYWTQAFLRTRNKGYDRDTLRRQS